MMSLTLQTEFHHILFLLDMSQLPTNSVNLQWIDVELRVRKKVLAGFLPGSQPSPGESGEPHSSPRGPESWEDSFSK